MPNFERVEAGGLYIWDWEKEREKIKRDKKKGEREGQRGRREGEKKKTEKANMIELKAS